MRLIDAEVFEELFYAQINRGLDASVAVDDALQDAPTIDAVPVVRCKNCQYAFQNNGHDKEGCPIMDRRVWMNGNSFCSEGKRMDGEAE
jgi:hypothetical protein